ncbi:hypothetical protein ISF_06375 [Cordyceps fumosorosea ARSEF 2679]|uniref:UBA domain-containing protein Ucp14 n=1 Tax=Cordyceps fumosorosea (strain ARSEF 2679) TaxID=1081104 RepID=A0A167SB10_CORFA|nr:hypothetical protein ISF_06375 [Cordyceps fumosorosea ARSEF 2679]OAA59440.1 hypothetical protein ISF_06375 [Cordyceps fumosorosea ARSEF 2679]
MTFTNTPVTRLVVLGLVSASIGASLLDMKHYTYILISPHLVLFAAMSLYNLRTVERMWGSRKYASFLVVTSLITSIVPPALMVVLRPLAPSLFNYMPAGLTPVIFAVLAQFHAMVPHMYKYRIATSSAPPTTEPFTGLTLSDKSYQYALALHLSLLQWPGSLVGAAAGWVVGQAWRGGLLPAALVTWRLPGWMVGVKTQRSGAEFEQLRRRLEGENATATGAGAAGVSTGVDAGGSGGGEQQRQQQQQDGDRRRTMGQQIVDQFREAL